MEKRINDYLRREAYKLLFTRILVDALGVLAVIAMTVVTFYWFWTQTTKDVLYYLGGYFLFGTMGILVVGAICEDINKAYRESKEKEIRRTISRMRRFSR